MAKVALLIGVSEYGSGFNPLPEAVKSVESVQQVLQPLEIGGFDQVKPLWNPNPPVMREAIETLFSGRTQDDLVLLFFSGHLVCDDNGKLYLATVITRQSPRAELIRVSAIPVSFVHDLMSNSPCQRQVVILDCCLSRVSTQEMAENADSIVDIKTQLGGKGRTILSSFSSTQNSSDSKASSHSVYTHYLVEGIRTGAADRDSDGWISVDELHEYASKRTQTAAPAVRTEFYPVEDGDNIVLFKAAIDDPKLKYRKEVESCVSGGKISQAGCDRLNKLAETLGVTSVDCSVIEAEVLKPYQEYQEKLQRYQRELAKAISNNYPLGTQEREELRSFQQSLGLRDQDVAPIEEQLALKLVNLSQSIDDAAELTQADSESKPNSLASTPNTVLQHSTVILPVQPTNSTPASSEKANEPSQADSESKPNSLPSTPNTVLQHSTVILPVQPTNPSPASSEKANEPSQADSESKPNSLASTPNTVLQQSTRILPVQPTNPTTAVNVSSNLAGSKTSSPSIFTFPYKIFLGIGIGGALVIVALAIGIFTRKPIAPSTNPADSVSSSAMSSPKLSPTAKKSNKESNPSPSSSQSKDCMIFVNGNLRSEPVSLENNVIESLREQIPVTGKRTDDGWVQVQLSSGRLGWAHPDIISSESESEMEACLAKKKTTTQ
jgi:uncharacterized caspase-like protein